MVCHIHIAITDDTQMDTIRLQIEHDNIVPDQIETLYEGRRTGWVECGKYNLPPKDIVDILRAKYDAGGVAYEFQDYSNSHLIDYDDIPEAHSSYYELRNIFNYYPRQMTTVEERRKNVESWARDNTDPRVMMRFVVNPRQATTAEPLTNRRYNLGQIWWEFVLMNTAAAQTDDWLEDDSDVWEAIERNMEVDVEDFATGCDVNDWNVPAGYMHSLSRMYKAAALLNDAPTEVVIPSGALPNLHAGSAAAKKVIYRK